MLNSETPDSPMVRAVVFDLDGLMFNTEEVFNLTGREQLRRRGKELCDDLLRQMMGRRAEESFTAMIEFHGFQETIEELQAESREIFFRLLPDHLAPMPGLWELLDHIEEHSLPKGVATSSSRAYLEDLLGRYELQPRFHTTLTAEDVHQGKPHPEIYLRAAERLGISPEEMLVLEDSEAGTRAAAAANAVVVSIPHRHSSFQDFSAATYVASSLDDPWILSCIGG